VVYIAHIGDAARHASVALAHSLRAARIGVITSTGGKSLKAQLRQANSLGVRYTVILGDDEVQKGEAVLRDMAGNTQVAIAQASLLAHLACT
ncbi:MAG TPA: histidine--tRNA ligase, partial [Candidatus Hydrogenedentes bacterium]|nr:histidine--tRNA ligase [Candidatus Hydrogenedentota bacterium]